MRREKGKKLDNYIVILVCGETSSIKPLMESGVYKEAMIQEYSYLNLQYN